MKLPFIAAAASLLVLCNVCTAALLTTPPSPSHPSSQLPPSDHVSFGPLRPWLSPAFPATPDPRVSMHDWFSAALSSVRAWALSAKSQLPSTRLSPAARSNERSDLPDLYWRFIPLYQASVAPGADSHWNTSCWAHVTASAAKSDTGLTITVAASERIGAFDCHDAYLLATVEGFHLLEVASDRVHTVEWSLEGATAADLSWIARNGVRAFRFMDDISLSLDELLHTVQ